MKVREGSAEGTWRQKLMQKLWRGVGYWSVSHGLISLLSYTPQDMPRVATLTMG